MAARCRFPDRSHLSLERPDCVAEDAANIEPVSTGQIPVYQGKEPGIL
jgi:hypothetical protein